MYLASSCSFGVLHRVVASCQSNPPTHRADLLPSQFHPAWFPLAGSGSAVSVQLSCTSSRTTCISSCISQDFLWRFFSLFCNLSLFLPLFFPGTPFMSMAHFSSFSFLFSATYKRFIFCFKVLARSITSENCIFLK